jgi:hypothetical protein
MSDELTDQLLKPKLQHLSDPKTSLFSPMYDRIVDAGVTRGVAVSEVCLCLNICMYAFKPIL